MSTWVSIDPFRIILWASIANNTNFVIPEIWISRALMEMACEFHCFRDLRILCISRWAKYEDRKRANIETRYLGQHYIKFSSYNRWTIRAHELRPLDVLWVVSVIRNAKIGSIGDLRNSSANTVVKKEGNSPVRNSLVSAGDDSKQRIRTRTLQGNLHSVVGAYQYKFQSRQMCLDPFKQVITGRKPSNKDDMLQLMLKQYEPSKANFTYRYLVESWILLFDNSLNNAINRWLKQFGNFSTEGWQSLC